MRFRSHRPDNTQRAIVDALRDIGVSVWHIGRPCDLLTFYRGRWLPLECKTPQGKQGKAVIDKRQVKQIAFLQETGTPRVVTPEEAIAAVMNGQEECQR